MVRLTISEWAIVVFLLAFPVYLMTPKHHKIDEQKVRRLATEYQTDRRYWADVTKRSQIIWSVAKYPGTLDKFVWRSTLYSWR